MYPTNDRYQRLLYSDIRPVDWKVSFSWDRSQDINKQFLTIGESIIRDNGDYIKPNSDTSIQLWDAFNYVDYSDRVLDIEWTRQNENIASVTLAYADITLNNYDGFFTPNGDSDISEFILPNRPVRILSGFSGELVPSFIGVTKGIPVVDERNKTVKIHALDFFSTILDRPLDTTQLFLEKRTDEILTALFVSIGIEETQLDLDEGEVTIPFCYFSRGDTLKTACVKLMEAEQGRLFLTETGTITFKNRQSYIQEPVRSYDTFKHITDIATRRESDLINVVIIEGQVREVQPNAEYWQLVSPTLINAGQTIDIFANFDDPATSVDTPLYIDDAITSSYSVFTQATGGVASEDVELLSSSLFSTAYRMTFRNNSDIPLYIRAINLWAEVASVVQTIYVREANQDSIDKFDEQILTINNDFFQSEDLARFQASLILESYKEYNETNEIEARGDSSLQVDDTIIIDTGTPTEFKVTKIVSKLTNPVGFKQVITVKNYSPVYFFAIGTSLIGGQDKIKPNL
jgi:hypothetical protein